MILAPAGSGEGGSLGRAAPLMKVGGRTERSMMIIITIVMIIIVIIMIVMIIITITIMKVFGENGEEQEAKDEIITEPSSIFNRLSCLAVIL